MAKNFKLKILTSELLTSNLKEYPLIQQYRVKMPESEKVVIGEQKF